jgi:GNAT superfamily N-acetyltransferase
VRIRGAEPSDVETIFEPIHELAVFERSEELVTTTRDQLRERLFGPAPNVFGDIVESDDGVAAGFAVWFLNYSSWTGTHGIYVEDLFIRPESRGHGYGTALLAHLARECLSRGYQRLQWSVLDWNRSAIEFYESLDAPAMGEWIPFRIAGDDLSRLATS